MHSIGSPLTGDLKSQLKASRKPLQPKNIQTVVITGALQPKKAKPTEGVSVWIGDEDKENRPISGILSFRDLGKESCPVSVTGQSIDASLAEELAAIRLKVERLRKEREKTENELRERDMLLEKVTKEMERRGREQKKAEIELDRVLRLKHLKASCLRICPVQSLREKELEKKMKEARLQETTQAGKEDKDNSAETKDEQQQNSSHMPFCDIPLNSAVTFAH